MSIRHLEEYRDPEISGKIISGIRERSRKALRLMEVCGTHTVSIFRNGIRSVLPANISLLSGPGCPVCVTSQGEIDMFLEVAGQEDVILTTFGDLMRVPGSGSSLERERADGRDIRMVYSAFDAVKTAGDNPGKRVVFLGVGFETTAPTVAASILTAARDGIDNFSVFSAHKLVPPALEALMTDNDAGIDGFILPGHVSTIIGTDAYKPFFDRHRVPCVVAGFEPVDILLAIGMLVEQAESMRPGLENSYQRAVTHEGNRRAMEIMSMVFETGDAAWRGLGIISKSGLKIREEFMKHDAQRLFSISPREREEPRGCACGEILTGKKTPPQCPLYGVRCSPLEPLGPCMVSSEGACAAYYRYYDARNSGAYNA